MASATICRGCLQSQLGLGICRSFRFAAFNRMKTQFGNGDRLEKLSRQEYWQHKYQDSSETFDWFLSKDSVASLVSHALHIIAPKMDFNEVASDLHHGRQVNILDLGCGNSALPLHFYKRTPFPVTVHCLDFVQQAVDFQLKTLRKNRPGHDNSYAAGVCASVCNLPYRSDLFHLVTDKGTMDSLLKANALGASQARQMLTEVERVLQIGGFFMQVTDEDPDSRMYFLETHSPQSCSWTFSILGGGGKNNNEYFVYSFCRPKC